jgi:hypothetical protein
MSELDLFIAALRIANAAERAEFLARNCEGNIASQQRIESLLLAHEQAGSFLASAVIDLPTENVPATTSQGGPQQGQHKDLVTTEDTSVSITPKPESTDRSFPAIEQAGDQIGLYILRERIGEGGMGVVYLAEQQKPVRRKVALKIIKPGMDTAQVVARFEA